MTRYILVSLLLLVSNAMAAVQFGWTDINLPSEGRRYVYAGTLTDLYGTLTAVDATRVYSNVQTTTDGVRFDVRTVVTRHDTSAILLDYVESRALTSSSEVLLHRVDSPTAYSLVGSGFADLVFTHAVAAPHDFVVGQTYSYVNAFSGSASGREQRSVSAQLIESVATGAGSMQAAKINSSMHAVAGTLMPSYAETGWYARNVGPVRLRITTGLQSVVDLTMVSANFALAPLAFDGTGPQITADPESIAIGAGTTARFRVLAAGGGLTYVWSKDGTPLPGATDATLAVPAVTTADAGVYAASVTASGVTVQSKPARLSVAVTGQGGSTALANLSVRAHAGDGDSQLIAGMVIAGTANPHRVLIRGAGPALGPYVGGSAAHDPSLTVVDANQARLAANDNWGESSDPNGLLAMMNSVGAFSFAPGSKDAAAIVPLHDGLFSALVRDQAGGTALVECYDADVSLPGGFINLSARADVRIEPLIAGIVITGNGAMKLLVRAVGPSLAHYGMSDVFPNPTLRIVAQDGSDIAYNDDWSTSAQKEDVRAAIAVSGAFPLDENSRDAALVATLPAGLYSAVIDSSALGGMALVEVYRLPQ